MTLDHFYSDDTLVDTLTREQLARGVSVFQTHQMADTEPAHVSALLRLFNPPKDAVVLDAGSGVGRVAELMYAERPDLEFILLNISAAQLALSPDFEKLHADFQDVPLADQSIDAVMFNYSLGHGNLSAVLAEAARLVRPNGILFIYDMAGEGSALHSIGYSTHPQKKVITTAAAFGFGSPLVVEPGEVNSTAARAAGPDVYDALFGGLTPIAYRFIKGAH